MALDLLTPGCEETKEDARDLPTELMAEALDILDTVDDALEEIEDALDRYVFFRADGLDG